MSWIMIMGKEVSRYSPKEVFLFPFVLFIPSYFLIFFSKVRYYGSRLFLPFALFLFARWGLSNKVVSYTLRIKSTSNLLSYNWSIYCTYILQGQAIYIYILRIHAWIRTIEWRPIHQFLNHFYLF
jgi:hypothetical protein